MSLKPTTENSEWSWTNFERQTAPGSRGVYTIESLEQMLQQKIGER
jgi:hypothetical protein